MKKYIFAISGASGPIIGIRVLKELVKSSEVHLTISRQALSIMKDETGIDLVGASEVQIRGRMREYLASERVFYWSQENLEAPIASGSFITDGMLVVPCSMKTLSGIANGYAGTLIERAADTTIKEGRLLLLSPREMPLSAIHLENMLKLARLGVRIAPPIPAFYPGPKSLDELIDFIAGKILDSIGIEHGLYKRWTGGS